MTARERLVSMRRALVATLALRAIVIALAVAVATLLAARLAGLGRDGAVVAVPLALAVAAWFAAPLRRVRSLERVALWVEERSTGLHYALVAIAGGASGAAIETQALAAPWWRDGRRRLARALAMPLAALATVLLLALSRPAVPHADKVARSGNGHPGAVTHVTDPLAHVTATVTPPAYAGRPTAHLNDPAGIDALVASVITISGEGEASAVRAALDSTARPVQSRDAGWSVTVPMPARPALLHLARADAAGRERLVVLAPVTDAPPVVTLLLPARDTVMRNATGTLAVRATLRDDIGLRDARFELVVSSGQEESFTFRSTVVGAARLANAVERTLDARVSLDSLALKPGDVLQLRAVAHDGNVATGPGMGSSETRSLRVARAGEYDSVSVDAAPPGDPEAQVLSQRMLITLTEALERQRRTITRATLLDEARRIAADQARLRKRVGDVVFQRLGDEPLGEETGGVATGGKVSPDEVLRRAEQATRGSASSVMDVEGDETPIVAINRPLLEAFNAMWDAGRSLEQGETDRALPPMRRALAAIERARQAERIYLRGRPGAVIVDIARARLAGKEHGASSVHEPRVPDDPAARRRAESFARATELLARNAGAAADTLLVMRVQALESAPALAAALDDAARAVRRGEADAIGLAWQRVRRALGPAPERGNGLGLWSGAP